MLTELKAVTAIHPNVHSVPTNLNPVATGNLRNGFGFYCFNRKLSNTHDEWFGWENFTDIFSSLKNRE